MQDLGPKVVVVLGPGDLGNPGPGFGVAEVPGTGSEVVEVPGTESGVVEVPGIGSEVVEVPGSGSGVVEAPGSGVVEVPGSGVVEIPDHGLGVVEVAHWFGYQKRRLMASEVWKTQRLVKPYHCQQPLPMRVQMHLWVRPGSQEKGVV